MFHREYVPFYIGGTPYKIVELKICSTKMRTFHQGQFEAQAFVSASGGCETPNQLLCGGGYIAGFWFSVIMRDICRVRRRYLRMCSDELLLTNLIAP